MSSFVILTIFLGLFFTNCIVRGEVRSNSRCSDVSLECEYREKYCFVPAYAGLMFKICRSSCDWCQKSLNDVIHSNRRFFPSLPADIPEWMTGVPPTPDNVEGSGSTGIIHSNCVDHFRTCSTTAALCQAVNYQNIMAQKCPKTCGICE
ncbi:hypothetical protein GCK72_018363 [Caenorhabditis remanei]|uniref:ShKT domain-containing protein n=1 Tax=Caenorhabditis remanei TaxID=31234 RepID=A0A6A5GBN7_CAERE|nr:hypothetical protein GCK72_018363 [Caenorhabditis remanei]KAF1751809.1 hypothetical protein GCK72_018363 [Caenorhabditis remanei]